MADAPIDKVRAPLERASRIIFDGELRKQLQEALSELEGCVVVPIEMTDEMNEAICEEFGCYSCTASWSDAERAWKSVIAPYVGEKK